ncbi:MAG TPA: glucose 1-dehydrogenase [Xanthomonadales bacterium]|nr:glucose 1-dehydrogenase [Xanthomonadales bacterium]
MSGADQRVFGIDGAVAVVTGAGAGIGRACAHALARAGARVVVNDLASAEAHMRESCDAIAADGGEAIAVAGDVSSEDDVAALFRETERRFGAPDILVANAGIEDGSAFAVMTLAQWRRVIDVNLTGAFLCAREAVRAFARRPEGARGSRIVFVSSVHERIPWSFQANYAASKGGVSLLMQSLAQELAPAGLRVNAVAPGAIRTDINRDAWGSPDALAELLRLIPQGRIGETGDVARAVLWLASPLSDYVNGATLFVDGAMSKYPAFRGAG